MRILLPVHHFPPRYSAGAELYTFRLARWLQQHGHDPEVVCVESIAGGGPEGLTAEHDTYQGLPVWRLSYALGADRRYEFDNQLLGRWFESHLRRARPDLAHFQAGYLLGAAPLRAAAAAGVPTVMTLHDYWFLCPRITLQRGDGSICAAVPDDPAACDWCLKLTSRRYRIPERLSGGLLGRIALATAPESARAHMAERRGALHHALGLPAAVISPSRFLAEQYAPHVPAGRMRVLRYGLDLRPFAEAARRAPDGVLRIGFTGQIAPHKGVHLLVSAFRALEGRGRPLELHLYGGLEAEPAYVRRLRELAAGDARVHFHGRFENGRAAALLAALDATVVPSTWYENSPLAISEAHAAGTPVVTAALGGMAELVRDGLDGLHFAAGDAADLARKLQRLVDEPELLPRLRAGVVSPRSIDDEMTELLAIYRTLAPQHAPGVLV